MPALKFLRTEIYDVSLYNDFIVVADHNQECILMQRLKTVPKIESKKPAKVHLPPSGGYNINFSDEAAFHVDQNKVIEQPKALSEHLVYKANLKEKSSGSSKYKENLGNF